jgi:hypothetical protein
VKCCQNGRKDLQLSKRYIPYDWFYVNINYENNWGYHDMPTIVHFEIPADDVDRAKKFYSDLFEWKMEEWPGADKKEDSFSMVCASRYDIELNIMPHTLHPTTGSESMLLT